MSGVGDSPELSLVNSSAADASARIRLFRLAFGAASEGQSTSSDELRRILSDHYSDGRISAAWLPEGDIPRKMAQTVILAVLCVEQSLPFGGELRIAQSDDAWTVTGTAERIRERPELWAGLTGEAPLTDLAPADVQYLLLNNMLNDMGRTCRVNVAENEVGLSF